MKEQFEEIKEDILDEEKAIEETLERLYEVRNKFDLQKEDLLTEPAMGTYLMNFYNGIENILKRVSKVIFPRKSGHNEELVVE
jgi:hypothetical protein